MISGPETKGKTLNTENKISSSFRPTSENVNVMSTFTINLILVYKWIWWWIKIFLLKKEERLRKREKRRRRKKVFDFLLNSSDWRKLDQRSAIFNFQSDNPQVGNCRKKEQSFFSLATAKLKSPHYQARVKTIRCRQTAIELLSFCNICETHEIEASVSLAVA